VLRRAPRRRVRHKAIARVRRADVVEADGVGLLPVAAVAAAAAAADGLHRLVDAAYQKRSFAISSNLHPPGSTQRRADQGRCLSWGEVRSRPPNAIARWHLS